MAVKSLCSVYKLSLQLVRGKATQEFHKLIDVHPHISTALKRKQPVVALESTIITHGMPYPQNLETAQQVEELVRKNGALPATIAIIDGRIKVGLSDTELLKLANKSETQPIKCSRRDMPFVLAQKLNGGTTVAATMLIAHMVGVRIFATGGIGGVHRDGHNTMDVSADLVQLGCTPVAVVCSGVKSILDIPRTLEYLETQGVCVATYGNADKRFPDFYTRDSGHKVPYNLKNAGEAAQLITTLFDLHLNSGIVIGVPIPEAYAVDKKLIDAAIAQAFLEAKQQGIIGKQITPFLLAAIAKITKGTSLEANIELIKNNAAIAAEIAREVYMLNNYSCPPAASRAPVIIGGCILDLSLTMVDNTPDEFDGATYRTRAQQSAGGVGRNLAEGIFKLHGEASFISIVGNDYLGKSLLEYTPQPLRSCVEVTDKAPTSLCSVILDRRGDCKLVVGNMEIHKNITPEQILKQEQLFESAPLLIIDANISLAAMECVLKLACKHHRPVFYEPTDMRIAGKPFQLAPSLYEQIRIMSPNIHELQTIVQTMTNGPRQCQINLAEPTGVILQKTKKLLMQIKDHFDCILVTLGHHGALVSVHGEDDTIMFDAKDGKYIGHLSRIEESEAHLMRFFTVPKVNPINNVSGAGDSFSSGFITGLLRSYNIDRSIAFGFAAAKRALQTESAVPASYFRDAQEQTKALQNTLKLLKKRDI